VVTKLKIRTDEVVNIAPVRALRGLVSLDCDAPPRQRGIKTKLSDISPLRGLALTDLNLSTTRVASIEVLKEMPISVLSLDRSPVSDLSPLRGKVLQVLHIGGTKVSSVSDVPAASVQLLFCYPGQLDADALQRLQVSELQLYGVSNTIDPEQLRALRPRLRRVMGKPVEEFLKGIEARPTAPSRSPTPTSSASPRCRPPSRSRKCGRS
jgi:hypothetical protein